MTNNVVSATAQEQNPALQEDTRANEHYLKPAVDILETEEGLTLLADLPGVDKEDLEIKIEKGLLTIEARVEPRNLGKEIYREYLLTSYYRQFQLSDQIDQSRTKAEFSNGVLSLTLAKAEAAKPRRIEISSD